MYFVHSQPSILAYYTNVVVGDRPEACALCLGAMLQLIILVFIPFLFVAERSAVQYDCRDCTMGNDDCRRTTSILSGLRSHFDNNGFAQLVGRGPFDSDAA